MSLILGLAWFAGMIWFIWAQEPTPAPTQWPAVQVLPGPDRELCRKELANPSRATKHLQVECVRIYGERP